MRQLAARMADAPAPAVAPAPAHAPAPASGGWAARLALRLEDGPTRTRLRRLGSVGPLYVQKPFYPEGAHPHVYLLHPPGGVVGGDRLEISVDVTGAAGGLLTTPAAAKFYGSSGALALQRQVLRVAAGASLEWLPQETIFFRGCRARVETQAWLEPGARFIGWETSCLGRPASGDHFESGCAESRLALHRTGSAAAPDLPMVIERNLWRAGEPGVRERWGLGGFTVAASLFATPADVEMLNLVRARLRPQALADGVAAVTLVNDVLIARVLAHHGEVARAWLLQVWEQVRPLVLGRAACPPRIWNT